VYLSPRKPSVADSQKSRFPACLHPLDVTGRADDKVKFAHYQYGPCRLGKQMRFADLVPGQDGQAAAVKSAAALDFGQVLDPAKVA